MILDNFLALTYAKLVNEPCINNFENITFEANKVKRGDLFFALNNNDIDLAVENGAYGVVFDKPTNITDSEIAWIKVDDLNDAIKRLLRFKMIEKEIVAYECCEIVLKLSFQVITQTNFMALSGDIKSIFKSLWNIEDRAIVLYNPSSETTGIFASAKKMPVPSTSSIEVMEKTLFETSFIYNNTFYERQLISPFFIPFLEELLYFYKTLNIQFRLKKFTPIEHFEAIFTNRNFEIKSFGTSDKVLIFETNLDLIEKEIEFLKSQASWANIIIIIPSTINIDERNVYRYEEPEDIMSILNSNKFHFSLIVGVDKSILDQDRSKQKQLTLDF